MGWDFLTCVHGVTEGLDSHDCLLCLEIAKKCNYDISHGKAYIFSSQKQIEKELKKAKKKTK
jgi:hypothetical protein